MLYLYDFLIYKLQTFDDTLFHCKRCLKTSEFRWSFPIIGINLFYLHCITKLLIHCVKSVQIRSFFGPYFPVFGLNTKIYGVNLRNQCEYRKIQTRKNSIFGHFMQWKVTNRIELKYQSSDACILTRVIFHFWWKTNNECLSVYFQKKCCVRGDFYLRLESQSL